MPIHRNYDIVKSVYWVDTAQNSSYYPASKSIISPNRKITNIYCGMSIIMKQPSMVEAQPIIKTVATKVKSIV